MALTKRIVIGLAALAFPLVAGTAEARSRHGHGHHVRGHHHHHYGRHHARYTPAEVGADASASYAPQEQSGFFGSSSSGAGDSTVVAVAARYIGGNPTGQRSLWCADFANLVLRQTHRSGTGSRMAKSFLAFPRTAPRPGAIAVMGRRGGGHVGFVAGFAQNGNPIIISGNGRGHRVSMSVYPRQRILKYVSPV